MLGIQQTHSAAAHHPTTRSAVAVAAGPLRTPPVTKRRQSAVQKQQLVDTVSTTQDNQETHAEAGAEVNSAWHEARRDENGVHEQRHDGNGGKAEEEVEKQDKLVSDSPNERPSEAPNGTTEQEKREGGEHEKSDGVDDYIRHPSSPLSELSPAPDDDENVNQEEDGGGDGGKGGEPSDGSTSGQKANGQPPIDGTSGPENSVPASSDGHSTISTREGNAHPDLSGSSLHNATSTGTALGSDPSFIDGFPPSSPLTNASSQFRHLTSTPPTSSPNKPTIENAHAGPSGLTSTNTSKSEKASKFSVLLELNAEIFKVCQAFVAAGYVPQETPEAQPFSKKLETNLTWMSARVDGVKFATSLPEMDPPVLASSAAHIAFPEGVFERINHLYAQLPVVFANDIARRNQMAASGAGTPTRNSSTPSLLPPSGIGVKRERPDSAGYARNESPTAAKRRDTGEFKSVAGGNTPTQPSSTSAMDMPPPTTPGFSPSHSQMARPGSSMGRVDPMSSGSLGPGSTDGMFSPNHNPGMGMGNSMQGLGNVGGLSPEAQARRQMQMRQAQAIMAHQQQLQRQHQQGQQQTNQQQHSPQQTGAQGGHMPMGSPQRPSQATLSPTQQQLMQAQAAAARHMSPPGAAANIGAGMGMGMNGTEGISPGQQSGMNSNMSHANMNANINGMGMATGSNMTLNPQMLANMGPAAMAAYQVLLNHQHPMTQYLNQHIPGFSQLPMIDQMKRFQALQQQRQLQQNQRNQQIMANQMLGSQMRQAAGNASGSGASQMQYLGQSGQMGLAPQLQTSTSEGAMQLPGTPTSANMPGRPATSMGMPQQMGGGMTGMQNIPNMANLNPQQRQLYLMQMQMRNAGAGGSGLSGSAGMNPSMMSPQLLQERQRLEQQRLALAQRHGSPLNPGANSGQFPPGLRSNPSTSVGISRTGRSPSVAGVADIAGVTTPRIGGRMLPVNEDYQRQVLLQQAQRNAQMQQQQQQQQGFMQGQGQNQGVWAGQQTQQLPLSAGAWPQQNQQGLGMSSSPPNTGMQGADFMSPSRQTSATPAPMGHHSPVAPSSDFDNMMNW